MIPTIFTPLSSRGKLDQLFGVDIRSLAILRIGIGLISLFCLIELLPDFYTLLGNDGLIPIELNKELLDHSNTCYWSFYWIDDSNAYLQALFGLHFIAAISLLVGFQTRWSTILCLVLTWSLVVRIPLLQDGGTTLLRMMLLWSAFLPLGRAWSVDAMLAKRSKKKRRIDWRVCNVATIALMTQALMGVLLFAIAICFGQFSLADWYLMEIKTKPMGVWLADHQGALSGIGLSLCLAAFAGAVSMFLYRVNEFFRGVWLALFLIFHLSIFLTLNAGVYPLMAIASWVIFLPSSFWNDSLSEPLDFDLKNRPRRNKSPDSKIPTRVCTVLFAAFLITSLIQWQWLSLGSTLNRRIAQFSQVTMMAPIWNVAVAKDMDSEVKVIGPRFVYAGELSTGETVNLVSPGAQEIGGRDRFYNENWRRLHLNLWEFQASEAVKKKIGSRLLSIAASGWKSQTIDQAASLLRGKMSCIEGTRADGVFKEVSSEEWFEAATKDLVKIEK